MNLQSLPQFTRNARRFSEIVGILVTYGLADWLKERDPEFIKGQLAPSGMAQGARIDILPNGKKLNKAYSLFAPNLMIHDENSKHHWDVIYKNPCGTYSYLYTMDKIKQSRKKKYQIVTEFEKYYPRWKR